MRLGLGGGESRVGVVETGSLGKMMNELMMIRS
jgi:hypothetical protein